MSAKELIDEGLRQRQKNGAVAALPLFERAAQLEPESHLPLLMLGNAATEMAEHDQAAGFYERARDLAPKNHIIRYNLGLCQLLRGYVELALPEFAGVCYLQPTYVPAQTSFIMALHYSDRVQPDEINTAIREWGGRYATQQLGATAAVSTFAAAPSRKLRVGFVSGDFRTHSVAHFFEPIARAYNRDAFEYILYNNSSTQDAVTQRLRAHVDGWRDVREVTDEALLELIRSDRIDILVDLSGYTDANRLAVFALRAAPVQATYLGFPNSTGLPAMDFRITDAMTDPHALADGWHTESLLHLPDSQWCFRPFGAPAPPGPLPARAAGYITFGSFNDLTKVSDVVLGCWIRILLKVPASRLRLTRVRSAKRAAEIVALFGQSGVTAERIECVHYQREVPYGLQFAGVDIALDPFPYNGVTTSCESLYVGVPVVSLYGLNGVSRSGLSLLSTLGLSELAAATPEEYVDAASALAGDLSRLEQLRGGLRDRFERSPLFDEKRFAAHFDDVLKTAWRRHLAGS